MTLRIESMPRLIIGTAIVALVVAALWLGGEHELALNELIIKGIATGVMLLLLPVVVIFHATRYPSQQHGQSVKKIDSLKEKIASHTAQQAAIDQLSLLYAEGRTLVGQKIKQEELDAWKMKCAVLVNHVMEILKAQFSDAEMLGFFHAAPTMTLSYNIALNEEHNAIMNGVIARLERLQKIIDQRQAALLKSA